MIFHTGFRAISQCLSKKKMDANRTKISKCEVWRPLSQHVDIRPATVTKGSRRFRGFAFRSRRLTGHEFAPMPHHLQGLETHLECWNKAAQTALQNMWKNSHVTLNHTEKKSKQQRSAYQRSGMDFNLVRNDSATKQEMKIHKCLWVCEGFRLLPRTNVNCFFFPITALECWSLSNWIFHHWTIELPSYKLSCSRPLTSSLRLLAVKRWKRNFSLSTVSMKQLEYWMLPLPVDCHSSGAFQGLHCAAMPGKQA